MSRRSPVQICFQALSSTRFRDGRDDRPNNFECDLPIIFPQPATNHLEIDKLPKERDEYALLRAMGMEAANVHLGTKKQIKRVLRDLGRRKPNWLRCAGKKMAKAIEKDWREYS